MMNTLILSDDIRYIVMISNKAYVLFIYEEAIPALKFIYMVVLGTVRFISF